MEWINLIQKKCVLTGLIFVNCIPASSQVYLYRDNLTPRAGDILVKQQVIHKNSGQFGSSVLWDFGDIDVVDSNYKVRYLSVEGHPDQIMSIDHSTRYYYQECGDSLVVTGMENPLFKIRYDEPYLDMLYPLTFGKSFEGTYHGRGLYCDKTPYREYGCYSGTVDAAGTLVLDADTLRNAVRLHMKKETRTIHYSALSYRDRDSLHVFTADSIKRHLTADNGAVLTDIYRWYVPGYRYPVLETIAIGNFKSTAFVITPDEQNFSITENTDNIRLREKYRQNSNNGIGHSVFSYNIVNNGAGKDIAVDFKLNERMSFSCKLVTIDGICLWAYHDDNCSGIKHLEIPACRLRNGIYIIVLQAGEQLLTEKIMYRNEK